jgi:hypothetical protein
LYHFLPELRDYLSSDAEQEDYSNKGMAHLKLLIQHLEDAYQPISKQLLSLLARRKITYDLLWAWFKPGMLVYITCPSIGLSRCIRYNFDKEKQRARGDCFEIRGHSFDFNGEVFGESTETVSIEIF